MFRIRKKQGGMGGFTLIELLVVIAIIGVLASVVLASLNSARRKSRDARRIADIKQIQLALELFFDSNGGYPLTSGALAPANIPTVPTDPVGTAVVYPYGPYTNSTMGTACLAVSGCLYYHLGANLEEDTNPALRGDRDVDSGAVKGAAPAGVEDGCADEAGRYCYDVTP